jgi:DNA-binding NtrC family response regulator
MSPADSDGADFRWQALFQRSRDAVFVLNRRRRLLFVNHAWEDLTSVPATEARGLVCKRRTCTPQDSWDVIIRAICAPPPEVLRGQASRSRRLIPALPNGAQWWDIEFLPLHDAQGLLAIVGKITPLSRQATAVTTPLPERLIALREATRRRYTLADLASELPAIRRLVAQVHLAAALRTPVCLAGEPGTGKHWLARCIHEQSPAREGNFAALECGRLPTSVLAELLLGESRLSRGLLTGTLYLREPQQLPRDLQARLAVYLSESEGPSGPRLLAGMRSDPAGEVAAGRLLDELHCLLTPLVVTLPSLRERLADLPLLVDHFLRRVQAHPEHRVTGLTAEAWEFFRAYTWPGNLRELYQVLQDACRRTPKERIDVEHLPAPLKLAVRLEPMTGPEPIRVLDLKEILEHAERRLIEQALKKAQGNRSRAADLLSVWRPLLLRRLKALKIEE